MIFTVATNLKSLYFATGYQRLRNLLMKQVTPTLARRHFALSFKGIQSNLKMSGKKQCLYVDLGTMVFCSTYIRVHEL